MSLSAVVSVTQRARGRQVLEECVFRGEPFAFSHPGGEEDCRANYGRIVLYCGPCVNVMKVEVF